MTAAHGTARRYWAGCRCAECRAAVAARAREVYRKKAYGTWNPRADAGPVRDHVRSLMDYGIGYERVAELASVPRATVVRLLYGRPAAGEPPTRHLGRETADRLLALRPNPALLRDGASVDACGTRRRLQALVACGWSPRRLAALLTLTPEHTRAIVEGTARAVGAGTARRARELYDRLWNQAPPEGTRYERSAATRARRHAEQERWPLPMAWDDDTIDDPAARPAAGWKRGSSTRISGDDVAELARTGATRTQIAERTGASLAAADRALVRARHRARTA